MTIKRSDEIVQDYIEMHWNIDDGEWIGSEWLREITDEFLRDYEKEWGGQLPGPLDPDCYVEELIKASGLEGETCETLDEMLKRLGYTDEDGDLLGYDECPHCGDPAAWSARQSRWVHRARASDSDCPAGRGGEAGPVPVSSDALDAINRHRRAVGQAPLDPAAAGWTAQDVEFEAKRIAQLNPDMAALKRKLMQ